MSFASWRILRWLARAQSFRGFQTLRSVCKAGLSFTASEVFHAGRS